MTEYLFPTVSGPIHGQVQVPTSKSASARALILAAQADGPSVLRGLLSSRDTDLMRKGLEQLGVQFLVSAHEVTVIPGSCWVGGGIIDVGLSGTVLRFLPPLAVLADAPVAFTGDSEASHRPIAPLLDALTQTGALVDSDRLPFTVLGREREISSVVVDSTTSSQFLSALLLSAPSFPNGLSISQVGELPSRPHVEMTVSMLRHWGADVNVLGPNAWRVGPGPLSARNLTIEPDLTNACVFLAAALATGGEVTVPWPSETVQAEKEFRDVLTAFGGKCELGRETLTVTGPEHLSPINLDLSQISEMTCVVAALACLADGPSTISGVAHVRGHETNRLRALANELTALGSDVVETSDGLTILPAPICQTRPFETYADHRMAHAAAILSLASPIAVTDITCTAKTMPDFLNLWIRLIGDTRE